MGHRVSLEKEPRMKICAGLAETAHAASRRRVGAE